MTKIKICFINHFGYSLYSNNYKDQRIGGAEVQLYLLSKEISKDNRFCVNVITDAYGEKQKMESFNDIKLFKILPTERTLFNTIKGFILFFKFLIKINPDIIIQRAVSHTSWMCALYAKVFGKKFIYSIANDYDVNGEFAQTIVGKLYSIALNHTYHIVSQSLKQKMILKKWSDSKKLKISVIKSGYPFSRPKTHNKRSILWVGRGEPHKRPEIFLRLAKRFPKQIFIMICNKSYDVQNWKKIRKKARSISNLKFFPLIKFENINVFFKDSKIFINTSNYEGFPNTFIQALKNQTPIISLKANPDGFITKYDCGFVCDDNFNKLVENSVLLLTNQNLYGKISQNAFKYAKEHHDIEKVALKWKKLFLEIMN
ncbi:MAG: glycosyltransferase [Candidatus Lokiarchaeota archaeon]|nr:glycosyltransferase [Candidatus Lokiarchaeota archaeon]